jgi:hypothetical protein
MDPEFTCIVEILKYGIDKNNKDWEKVWRIGTGGIETDSIEWHMTLFDRILLRYSMLSVPARSCFVGCDSKLPSVLQCEEFASQTVQNEPRVLSLSLETCSF